MDQHYAMYPCVTHGLVFAEILPQAAPLAWNTQILWPDVVESYLNSTTARRPLLGDHMSDERSDRSSPNVHDRLHDRVPANGSRKRWVAPKVIVSAFSSTAANPRPPREVGTASELNSATPRS